MRRKSLASVLRGASLVAIVYVWVRLCIYALEPAPADMPAFGVEYERLYSPVRNKHIDRYIDHELGVVCYTGSGCLPLSMVKELPYVR
jgi:hypothetical protein